MFKDLEQRLKEALKKGDKEDERNNRKSSSNFRGSDVRSVNSFVGRDNKILIADGDRHIYTEVIG